MDITPIPPEPDWQNSAPAMPLGISYQPKRRQFPKLSPNSIRFITIGAVALPILVLISYWALTSIPSKKVAPTAQFNPHWAIDQVNADYLNSQQQMHLFLWGNDQGDLGQWNRLIRAEAQRMALAVDQFRANQKHPCYRMSRDGCLDTVENSIEKEWNNAAIRLDNPGMARALFRYAAVSQARSGQIDSVDTRPNLFVAAIRKMRSDRSAYLQQTTEAEAGRQLEEQRQAEREFNQEVKQP